MTPVPFGSLSVGSPFVVWLPYRSPGADPQPVFIKVSPTTAITSTPWAASAVFDFAPTALMGGVQ